MFLRVRGEVYSLSWEVSMLRTIFLLAGIIAVVGLVMGGSFVYDVFLTSPEEGVGAMEIVIEPGTSVKGIADQLLEQEIISSKFFFELYVAMSDQQMSLQAGSFSLVPGTSLRELVVDLTSAEASESQVTIPEGYTLEQIQEVVVEGLENVTEKEWVDVTGENGKLLMTSTKLLDSIPTGQSLEGYLFPDTYRFRTDADAQTVVDTMVLTLERRLAENEIVVPEDGILDNGMSMHDLITLASVVEREVQSVEDMAVVAGIFLNRMDIGMALQACSTVNYITGKNDPAVTLEDSQIDSPYNTYQNLGLPPGPIANPGMNAIMAVLDPQDTSYMYFLSTEEGETVYASTYDEHIANKYKYLK